MKAITLKSILKSIALCLLLAAIASAGATTSASAVSEGDASEGMDAAVTLSIPDNIQVMAGDLGNVPITFASNGNSVTSLAFELHYDTTKLALKLGPNSGGFREVLSVSFANLPATYEAGAFVVTGVEGDVEFFMHIDPGLNPPPNPLPLIPNGVVATLTFTAIGASGVTTPLTFELANPAPSAGLSNGQSNPDGVTVDNGSIDIIPAVQNLALKTGYNLIGLTVVPTSALPKDAFASIISVPASSSPLEIAFAFTFPAACAGAGSFKSYSPERPINSLTSVNVTQGIWLKMRQDATLTLTGAFPLRPFPIHLCPGFNLIAYPSRNAANINPLASGALSSINGQFNSVFGEYNPLTDLFKSYVVGRPINPLTQMKGGVGYWIDATVETDLTIPDN